MLCTDTQGEHPAIHISRPVLELAVELAPMLDAIQMHGQGEGQITLHVKHGHIPIIEYMFRLFRGKKKVIN